jgi:hypothetical protein
MGIRLAAQQICRRPRKVQAAGQGRTGSAALAISDRTRRCPYRARYGHHIETATYGRLHHVSSLHCIIIDIDMIRTKA